LKFLVQEYIGEQLQIVIQVYSRSEVSQ